MDFDQYDFDKIIMEKIIPLIKEKIENSHRQIKFSNFIELNNEVLL